MRRPVTGSSVFIGPHAEGTRAWTLLGWPAATELQEGLERTLHWMCQATHGGGLLGPRRPTAAPGAASIAFGPFEDPRHRAAASSTV